MMSVYFPGQGTPIENPNKHEAKSGGSRKTGCLGSFLVAWLAYTAFLTYAHFIANPLPFPDRGNWIFTVPGTKEQKVATEIFQRYGEAPRFQINTKSVLRTFFWQGTIINVTLDKDFLRRLHNPVAARAFVVDDPTKEAQAIATYLRQEGFEAIVAEIDPDVGQDLMAVATNALGWKWLVIFRKHVTLMGGPGPVPYKEE